MLYNDSDITDTKSSTYGYLKKHTKLNLYFHYAGIMTGIKIKLL